jgi:uncharacterized protein YggU (UPF0235/DUF167 family)
VTARRAQTANGPGPVPPYEAVEDGVRLVVRLTPKASRTAILGLAPEPDGGAALKCLVTALPEGGKANAALIAMLAKALKRPKGSFALIAGATGRRKTLHITGDPQTLLAALGSVMHNARGANQ